MGGQTALSCVKCGSSRSGLCGVPGEEDTGGDAGGDVPEHVHPMHLEDLVRGSGQRHIAGTDPPQPGHPERLHHWVGEVILRVDPRANQELAHQDMVPRREYDVFAAQI